MITETALDNVLVHQKDLIIKLIDGEHFQESLNVLNVVRELWDVTGYHYKRRELLLRTIEAIEDKFRAGTMQWKRKETLQAMQSQLRYAMEH